MTDWPPTCSHCHKHSALWFVEWQARQGATVYRIYLCGDCETIFRAMGVIAWKKLASFR